MFVINNFYKRIYLVQLTSKSNFEWDNYEIFYNLINKFKIIDQQEVNLPALNFFTKKEIYILRNSQFKLFIYFFLSF